MIKIQVKKVDKPGRIPREVRERLKELRMTRRLSFMKKERLLCPIMKDEITPVNCFACEYFARRIKGFVHCKADN
ncbi:MAG: hypothetical protein GTN80_11890 [Nitrososphaeria archaeon]|nr:hypothetical protein [Nitrososphaeria archaeon]NIN53758.1 hypothetical protein [Nitrososphaeria archaeon]NIQ34318.1 hypothetical protein [Nitrososphaeria archaeon]